MTYLGGLWVFRLVSMFVRLFVEILVLTANPETELVESANTVVAIATAGT
jgi:hypothetical protein